MNWKKLDIFTKLSKTQNWSKLEILSFLLQIQTYMTKFWKLLLQIQEILTQN